MAHEIIGSVQGSGCDFDAKMYFAKSNVNVEAVKVLGITIALDEVIE